MFWQVFSVPNFVAYNDTNRLPFSEGLFLRAREGPSAALESAPLKGLQRCVSTFGVDSHNVFPHWQDATGQRRFPHACGTDQRNMFSRLPALLKPTEKTVPLHSLNSGIRL